MAAYGLAEVLCLVLRGVSRNSASIYAGLMKREKLENWDNSKTGVFKFGKKLKSAQGRSAPIKSYGKVLILKGFNSTGPIAIKMKTARKPGPHSQTDRGTCPGVGL
jgi:hypothetical protein